MTQPALPLILPTSHQAGPPSNATSDARNDEERKKDAELAERLSRLIEDANSRVVPLCKMIRKHIENMEARKEEDRNEGELVQQTMGMIKGADPDNRLSDRAKRHAQTHNATPEEQRLAEALKVLLEEVGGTIEWARDKLDSFPKAKKISDPYSMPLVGLDKIYNGLGLGKWLNTK
ncbi:hypothetical protein C8R42DRAFT_724165 [Lentinula raphanica]|nr:hypothetical protein C8R42DRAFT_724165 [Lentinula raphanica]